MQHETWVFWLLPGLGSFQTRIILPHPCRWDALCQGHRAQATGVVRECSLTGQSRRLHIFNFSQAVWVCAIVEGTRAQVRNLTRSLVSAEAPGSARARAMVPVGSVSASGIAGCGYVLTVEMSLGCPAP